MDFGMFTVDYEKEDFDRIEEYIMSDEFGEFIGDTTTDLRDGLFIVQAVLDRLAEVRAQLDAE